MMRAGVRHPDRRGSDAALAGREGGALASLMAICYQDTATASLAMSEVERRSEDLGIAPDAVAAIIRDRTGKFTAITNARAVAEGSAYAMFWGPLFGYLFFVPFLGMAFGTSLASLMSKVERIAMTPIFESRVRDLLKPETSALFVMIDDDPDELLGALSQFSGTVLKSSLSREGHDRLQEALHGRPTAVRR
jgi:uncharacterized membrane protein